MIELAEYIVSTFIVGSVAFLLVRVIAAAFDRGDPHVKPKVEEDPYLKAHLGARLLYYTIWASIAAGALGAIWLNLHQWSSLLTRVK